MTTRIRTPFLLQASVGVLVLGIAPAAASAATVERTATSGPAVSEYIHYKAGKGEKNKLAVTVGKNTITFTDTRASLKSKKSSFGTCKVSGHAAVCKVDPTTPVLIDLGDKDDSVRFKGDAATDLDGTDTTQVANVFDLADPEDEEDGGFGSRTMIYGGSGNDLLKGSIGSDVVDGGTGKDKVYTGAGDDTIYDRQDKLADIIGAGQGVDTVGVRGTKDVTIDLGLELIISGSEMTSLDSVERARGGDGDDTLLGSDGIDGLFGGDGNDTIDGGAGADYVSGGAGTDKAAPGEGDVSDGTFE